MRLCFVADGHSPIARAWIAHFVDRGHEVHTISSCVGAPIDCDSYTIIPTLLGGIGRLDGTGGSEPIRNPIRRSFAKAVQRLRGGAVERFAQGVRFSAGWIDLPRYAARIRSLVAHINPDVVHAMRIPFEGLIASH